jgi:hypothetical protein
MNNSPADRRSPLGLFPGQPTPRLYERVVEILRTRHYSRRTERISVTREAGVGKVSEGRVEGGPVSSFGILRRGKTGPFRSLWKHLALHTRLTVAFGAGQPYVIGLAGRR